MPCGSGYPGCGRIPRGLKAHPALGGAQYPKVLPDTEPESTFTSSSHTHPHQPTYLPSSGPAICPSHQCSTPSFLRGSMSLFLLSPVHYCTGETSILCFCSSLPLYLTFSQAVPPTLPPKVSEKQRRRNSNSPFSVSPQRCREDAVIRLNGCADSVLLTRSLRGAAALSPGIPAGLTPPAHWRMC